MRETPPTRRAEMTEENAKRARQEFKQAKQKYARVWWQSRVNPTIDTIMAEIWVADELDDAQAKMQKERMA